VILLAVRIDVFVLKSASALEAKISLNTQFREIAEFYNDIISDSSTYKITGFMLAKRQQKFLPQFPSVQIRTKSLLQQYTHQTQLFLSGFNCVLWNADSL
jgi:hypothetical protein